MSTFIGWYKCLRNKKSYGGISMGYNQEDDIKEMVIESQDTLIDNIKEAIEVYTFLHRQALEKVEGNGLFIFTFRSFYNIDSRGVTDTFEQKYFSLMEQHRAGNKLPNITIICDELYQVKNKYGNPTMQFPLVTNMLNTLNPYFPTFEQEIADLFSFTSTRHLKGFYKKMKRYLDQYRILHETYCNLVTDPDLADVFAKVNKTYEQGRALPNYKKLDLLMLQLGRLSD